jgi:phosphoribosylformylglycinamidine cyclo-ligase
MKAAVTATHGPNVLAGIGAFGGLYSLAGVTEGLAQPALVASTDGVGTKVKLAAAAGRYRGIGQDIVNHCLNDIACAGEGVRPLLFLDYIASSKLSPEMVAEVVGGIAGACRAVGCALLGGETAEMPGVYQANEFDLVGTIIGIADAARVFPRPTLAAGDVLLGLPSSGPHTNGYSLIRAIFADTPLDTEFPGVGRLVDALLTPHRCYVTELARLRVAGVAVQGVAHITGGGLVENIPRALPAGLSVQINPADWPTPPLFQLIQQKGGVSEAGDAAGVQSGPRHGGHRQAGASRFGPGGVGRGLAHRPGHCRGADGMGGRIIKLVVMISAAAAICRRSSTRLKPGRCLPRLFVWSPTSARRMACSGPRPITCPRWSFPNPRPSAGRSMMRIWPAL